MNDAGPGQVLFDFVRHWSRRFTGEDGAPVQNGRLVLVTGAVHSLTTRGKAATVTAVTAEIGLDQSGASRLIKSAVEAGYLTLEVSTTDARHREASLTTAGHTLLSQAHRWQEQVFEMMAEGWSEQQRNNFQQAMTTLMERSYLLQSPTTRR